MEAATNPTLEGSSSDPTLFCTAYKKNRFYMFTRLVLFIYFSVCLYLLKMLFYYYKVKYVIISVSRREPEDIKSIDADRDVFNERPSKEDIISSTEAACKLIF